MQTPWIVLAELVLDSGTEYVATTRVERNPSIIYSGVLLNGGSVDKTIPLPSGMPQISDARIRLADPKRKWRDLLLGQISRRRVMQLTLMKAGDSIADYAPVYVGEVSDVSFPPASVEITLKDRLFAWIDEPIPAMAVPALYPDISAQDNGGFIPLVWGQVRSISDPPQGVIPLPHLGLFWNEDVGQTVDRWAAAMTPITAVTVYRHRSANVNTDGPEWVLVDPSEYVLSTDTWTEGENPFGPFQMTHSYVDFLVEQPSGTEIRADIDGTYARGAWGSLPDLNTPGSALRNPIDFFIGLAYFISRKAGVPTEAFDVDGIAALRTVFENLHYFCDGAVTEPITLRSFFGQFLASFNLNMFVNRLGKITLYFPQAEDPDRPVLTEGKHIGRESFIETLPPDITNQIRYQLQWNNAVQTFETSRQIDLPDQEAAAIAGEPKIMTEALSEYFIRDEATAEAMALKRIQFVSPGSYRQQFKVPAPLVWDVVDVTKQVGITHSMGLDIGGYQNREAVITGTVLDLDKLEYTLTTVLRVPQFVTGGVGHGRMQMAVGRFRLTGFPVDITRGCRANDPDVTNEKWFQITVN